MTTRTNDTNKYTLQYFYNGKLREAEVTIINTTKQGPVYWFHWRKGPPGYLCKKDGVWLLDGAAPLTIECERGDIYLVLAAAIEEQLIQKF